MYFSVGKKEKQAQETLAELFCYFSIFCQSMKKSLCCFLGREESNLLFISSAFCLHLLALLFTFQSSLSSLWSDCDWERRTSGQTGIRLWNP